MLGPDLGGEQSVGRLRLLPHAGHRTGPVSAHPRLGLSRHRGDLGDERTPREFVLTSARSGPRELRCVLDLVDSEPVEDRQGMRPEGRGSPLHHLGLAERRKRRRLGLEQAVVLGDPAVTRSWSLM